MTQSIKLTPTKDKVRTFSIIVGLLTLFIVSLNGLQLDLDKFMTRFANMGTVLSKFVALDLLAMNEIISELLLSIFTAIGALFIGTILSLIFAFLAARNIAPSNLLSILIKAMISIIRAVPALVWILMIVASLGFGVQSGLVGLIFPTVGYLTKSFIASIEDQKDTVIETMRATGASWLQLIFEGLLPGLVSVFLSWIAIRLEGNIAESISLGMVGAGGIGMVLTKAIGQYNYPKITTIVLVIFIVMFTVELLVNQLKKNLANAQA
ncbi:hypothetical protein GCM10011482_23810 [Enterococcus alcedinis]|uniref:ABC transmembrane type-1 domain-containing protein n=1 Tax=Enterococcus alcedinis TaxID=1274384 RepID=A0A917N7C5_9ENTE|nr:ABC transporter permease subunit [Enterococcus alcedinis]MBP2103132.1 phosphonate transport system permease protein [Enterococcus alcedinis]GGI66727.1 hypothetical protein GCM10011482_23810 [Enterococcus alcedinis]